MVKREMGAASKLARFRARHGVSLRLAARSLGVSAPTVLDWERGRKVPSPPLRRAILIWTDGHIREEEWMTPRERAIEARMAQIRPYRAPNRRRRRAGRGSSPSS